jgi:hypothetical protein
MIVNLPTFETYNEKSLGSNLDNPNMQTLLDHPTPTNEHDAQLNNVDVKTIGRSIQVNEKEQLMSMVNL